MFDLQANADPLQSLEEAKNAKLQAEWEQDYKTGAKYLEAKKYLEAENALSFTLTHLREAQENRKRMFQAKRGATETVIKNLKAKILVEGNDLARLDESAALKQYEEELQQTPKEENQLPDARMDKTKHLLAECYKQHIAFLKKATAPFKFIPKEWLMGLYIACGIIFIFGLMWARYLRLHMLNVNLNQRYRLLATFLTVCLLIGSAYGYYVLSRASSKFTELEKLEQRFNELISK